MTEWFLRRLILSFTIALSAMTTMVLNIQAQDAKPSEYGVKAAFLYNFAKFVDWPVDAFKDDQSPICLSVLGDDPFGPALDSIRDKTVRGRPLIVRRCKSLEQVAGSHIVFISLSEKGKLRPILNGLKRSSTLTVSEAERFGQQGGMINFITVDNKIQFEINPEAAQRVKLKISSQLLKLARIVTTESPKERE